MNSKIDPQTAAKAKIALEELKFKDSLIDNVIKPNIFNKWQIGIFIVFIFFIIFFELFAKRFTGIRIEFTIDRYIHILFFGYIISEVLILKKRFNSLLQLLEINKLKYKHIK